MSRLLLDSLGISTASTLEDSPETQAESGPAPNGELSAFSPDPTLTDDKESNSYGLHVPC